MVKTIRKPFNKINVLAVFAICCLGIIAYSNTFFNSFHLDDFSSITDNLAIQNINNFGNIWNFWPTRFVTYLSVAMNFRFGGLDVFGYHLFNLLVHLISAILLWWLVLLTFATPTMKNDSLKPYAQLIAFFASLVFLLHPIQTQPVNYIIQRAVLLATCFFIASLALYVKARLILEENNQRKNWKIFYFTAILSACLSMFSKEMAITLPITIILYEFFFFRAKGSTRWKYAAPFLALVLIIPLTMWLSRSVNIREMHRVEEGPVIITAWHYFLTQLRVIVTYIRLLFIPVNQNLDYDYPIAKAFFEVPVILSLLLILAILSICIKLRDKKRLASFGIAWFFITLLPESSFIPIQDVIFEHRLYLSMAGFSMVLVSVVFYLFGAKRDRQAIIALCFLIICYGIITYQRNKIWNSEFTLWSDVLLKSPQKARPYLSRGTVYQRESKFDQAISDYAKAIELKPDYADAYYNRGLTYNDKGDYNRAISDYTKAIEIDHSNAKFYNNRGNTYSNKGDFIQAISDYTKAIEINPAYADAYFNRASAYFDQGDSVRAISDYTEAIRINSGYADAYLNRGFVYSSQGNYDQAIADYTKAISLNLNLADAYNNRAVSYFLKHDFNKAWDDVHNAESLGCKVDSGFLNKLTQASGRER